MIKTKKCFTVLASVLCAIMCALCLVACGDNSDNTDKGGVKNYTMEAEYINLDDVIGAGISSEANGVSMIYGEGTKEEKDKGWSSGYYVGFTYSANLQLDFVFESDKAATSTIILRLGSELGDLSFDVNSLAIKVNGTAITYANMFIIGSADMPSMAFTDKTVATNVSLLKGKNTVSIVVLDNKIGHGKLAAPMVDCIKIKTAATLTWTDKLDNPGRRGEI